MSATVESVSYWYCADCCDAGEHVGDDEAQRQADEHNRLNHEPESGAGE